MSCILVVDDDPAIREMVGMALTREGYEMLEAGSALEARHLPRLTERLYRVDASRSRNTGGTGLGLAIIKYILERHGAELDISSTVGRGSSFTCHFPVESIILPKAVRNTAASD